MAGKNNKSNLQEITTKLYSIPVLREKREGFDLKKYIGTQYDVIGLSVPQQLKAYKSGYSFSSLPLEKQLAIWNNVWKESDVFDVLSQCLDFLGENHKRFDAEALWKIVKHWVKKIDNWANSDDLSSVYAYLMEREPELVYEQLLKWNSSKNPWERRASLVTMLLYCRRKKTALPVEKVIRLIEPRLDDENYFVQKGVGWALRDTGVVYPKQIHDFLLKHITRIDPAAFTAAVEKIDPGFKSQLKALRSQRAKKTRASKKSQA